MIDDVFWRYQRDKSTATWRDVEEALFAEHNDRFADGRAAYIEGSPDRILIELYPRP